MNQCRKTIGTTGDDDGSRVPAQPTITALTHPGAAPTLSLDQCIIAWLHEKTGRSESAKTERAYQETIQGFRMVLHTSGTDLDGPLSTIALDAQGWAAASKRGVPVAPKTYNQRLAILSSFYRYAIKHELLTIAVSC